MPYTWDEQTKTYISNSITPIKVEVGDSKEAATFQPRVKLMAWDNECNVSFGVAADTAGKGTTGTTASVEIVDSKIIWSDGCNLEAHFYDKPADEQNEDGAYEFEVILKEKPSSNVITLSMNAPKELEFCYQPELTQEEIDEGHVRPDNVVGSYAVYHSSKANNQYKAGKAFHIYRPFATDAKGNTTWCDLYIDPVNLVATITIPQKYLGESAYPVVVDPTFGYTSAGASSTKPTMAICMGGSSFIHTASSGDTITGYSLYAITSGFSYGVAVYSISTTPQNRLAAAVDIELGATAAWCSVTGLSQSLTGGTAYGVAFGNKDGTVQSIYYDTGTGDNRSAHSGATLDAAWSHQSWGTGRYSIYATYTAGGGGGSDVNLTGAIDGAATVTGVLNLLKVLTGAITANATVAGLLNITRALAGTITSTATIAGQITLGAIRDLAGTISSTATVAGNAVINRALAGAVNATATIAGALGVIRPLTGAANAVSNVSATLSRLLGLRTQVDATSTVIGVLDVDETIELTGAVTAEAIVTGVLSVDRIIDLEGLIEAQSTVELSLGEEGWYTPTTVPKRMPMKTTVFRWL